MHSYFIITWGITNILLLIASVAGSIKYPFLKSEERQYVYYLGFLFLIEAITNVLTSVFHYKNTSFLYPVYIAGEFFLLTTLLMRKLHLSKYWMLPVLVLSLIFLGGDQVFDTFNNDIAKVISNIIIISFAGYLLLQEIKNGKTLNRFTFPDACIFFYYSVSIFIFIIQHQIASLTEDNYYMILGTNNILSSILYGSFLYTFATLKK